MEKKVYPWKDITSAIVLFLIWVGHLGGAGALRVYITTFANPVFFLIAGFFAEHGQKYKLGEWLIRNVKRLLVPYCGWALISVIFYNFTDMTGKEEAVAGIYSFLKCNMMNMPYGGQSWFLLGIFICRILYEFIRRLVKNRYCISGVCLIITLVMVYLHAKGYPVLNYGYTRGVFWIFFYSLGPIVFPIFNKVYESLNAEKWNKAKALSWFAITLFSVIAVYVYFHKVDGLLFFGNIYLNEVMRQVIAPWILAVHLILLTLLVESDALRNLGQNTLILCGTEGMLKTAAIKFARMLDINLILGSALQNIFFVAILFYVEYKWIIPFINRSFPVLAGKSKTKK